MEREPGHSDERSPHHLIAGYRNGLSCFGPVLVKDDAYWEAHTVSLRRKIFKKADAQWWLCWHCSLPMTEGNVTRDHLIPKSKGGKGLKNNTVAACAKCNHKKGNRLEVPSGHLWQRRRQYYRSQGLRCEKPRKEWAEMFPNFGLGLDGKRPLWAPQFGIM